MQKISVHPQDLTYECGDFDDNQRILTIACDKMERGEESGRAMLRTLREHILQTCECQSVKWLLPVITGMLLRTSSGCVPKGARS